MCSFPAQYILWQERLIIIRNMTRSSIERKVNEKFWLGNPTNGKFALLGNIVDKLCVANIESHHVRRACRGLQCHRQWRGPFRRRRYVRPSWCQRIHEFQTGFQIRFLFFLFRAVVTCIYNRDELLLELGHTLTLHFVRDLILVALDTVHECGRK